MNAPTPTRRLNDTLQRAPGTGWSLPLLAALMSTLASPLAAQAQTPPSSFIALGAISLPEYEGSDARTTAPLLIGRIDLGSAGALRLVGLGLQYNVMDAQSAWAFGPLLSARAARDADVDDEVVKTLREVDSAVELGAFVEYGLRDALARGDRLALGLEAKAGKGSQFSLTASYLSARQGGWQFGADARLTSANDKYMDSYFSVDADNAARSGLPQYTAGSGAKSFGLGLSASVDIDRHWLLIGRVGFSRLLGDARDSPIVQLRGEASGTSAGLALGYRF